MGKYLSQWTRGFNVASDMGEKVSANRFVAVLALVISVQELIGVVLRNRLTKRLIERFVANGADGLKITSGEVALQVGVGLFLRFFYCFAVLWLFFYVLQIEKHERKSLGQAFFQALAKLWGSFRLFFMIFKRFVEILGFLVYTAIVMFVVAIVFCGLGILIGLAAGVGTVGHVICVVGTSIAAAYVSAMWLFFMAYLARSCGLLSGGEANASGGTQG